MRRANPAACWPFILDLEIWTQRKKRHIQWPIVFLEVAWKRKWDMTMMTILCCTQGLALLQNPFKGEYFQFNRILIKHKEVFKKRRRNPKIHRGKNYKESGQCLLSLRWGWRRWRQGGWWRCWQQREWLCGLPSVWVSWEVSGSGETFLLPTERHCVALIAVQCKQCRSNAHSLQISELLVYLSVAELLFWVSCSQNNQYLPPILWVWSLSVSPYLYYPSLY